MQKQRSKMLPLIATGIVPAAAITVPMLPAVSMAGPGDLDPAFGDVGRLGPILDGPAWSLQPQTDGAMILGGGRPGYTYYYWGGPYYSPPTAFVNRLSADGVSDPTFAMAALAEVQVLDTVVQPDGKVVAVGRQYLDQSLDAWQAAVFRLNADGTLDAAFANQGLFTLSAAEHGRRQIATSVVLDPDGRIVVAGSRDDVAIVFRLLPEGSVDDAFGASGIAIGPRNLDFSSDGSGARTAIVRASDGGYRLTASNAAGCQLFALTSTGAAASGFGNSGIATAWPAGEASAHCNALAMQTDGALVTAGSSAGQGFVTRRLADGSSDAGFDAGDLAGVMTDASAVAIGNEGAIVVGGAGPLGAMITRLQGNGTLDTAFGDAGVTMIDLEHDYVTEQIVHDIAVSGDGSILAAGGADNEWQAFVIRLLGDGGGESPGVLGFVDYALPVGGEGGEAVMTLRRTGGSSGTVSIAYQLVDADWDSAVNGVDFDFDAGRLTWADGDRSNKEIRIPILADNVVEGPEYFALELRDVEGGAGIGSYVAYGEIPADGGPHGQLGFEKGAFYATEGNAATIRVRRSYYSGGEVSVTLTPASGTATAGVDFDASPVTLTWADGDFETKTARITIVDDADQEPTESFTVEMTSPVGGAVLAGPVRATVNIGASDRPASAQDSGGGSMGLLATLLLGAAALCRRILLRGRHVR